VKGLLTHEPIAGNDVVSHDSVEQLWTRLIDTLRRNAAHFAVAVLVFLAHVSLWNAGFLEEIGLARLWQIEGIHGVFARFDSIAARPLNLVPHYAGLELSSGGLRGMYVVMGCVTAAQYLTVVWAIRPATRNQWVRAAVGLAVALHPLWPAGWILRFLTYQVTVLAITVWAGCVMRYLIQARRARVLVAGCLVLMLGLFHIASLIVVPFVVLAALLCHERAGSSPRFDARRWARAFGATAIATAVYLAYVFVVVPRISDTSYDNEVMDFSVDGLRTGSRQLFRTALGSAPYLVVYVLILAASCVLVYRARSRHGRAFASLAVILAALLPLAALSYASYILHARDPDRVLAPCSLAAVAVGWSLVSHLETPIRARQAGLAAVLLATIGLSTAARADWADRGHKNEILLRELSSAIETAPSGVRFVVVDHSGTFGDVYSFLPPMLRIAVAESLDREVDLQLCTADGVTRHHSDAARYPIGTTPDCSTLLKPGEGTTLKTIDVEGDSLTLVAVPSA